MCSTHKSNNPYERLAELHTRCGRPGKLSWNAAEERYGEGFPELFLSLPAQEQGKLQDRPDYVKISNAIEAVTRQVNGALSPVAIGELKFQRAKLYELR